VYKPLNFLVQGLFWSLSGHYLVALSMEQVAFDVPREVSGQHLVVMRHDLVAFMTDQVA
jgi:hypothetical protein